MAARRSRRRRRRGRFGFLYKLLSVVLILVALVAGCIVFFRVETITIAGSTVYTDEKIIAAAEVELGDNLFLVGTVQTGRKITSRLPYIDTASLSRSLPDTLVITVTECVPAGVLKGEEGTWWVVDSACKLLEQGGSELTGRYPRITGLTALMPSAGKPLTVSVEESTKLDSLKQLLSALSERGMLAQVQSIDLSGTSEIHMEYENRFSVYLPLYSDDFHLLAHKLQAAAEYLNAGQTGTIDLTVKRSDGAWGEFIPD
ncbi:MAG: cell division protein FtsQ/DivIB [Oscillospiraceae bacterium]